MIDEKCFLVTLIMEIIKLTDVSVSFDNKNVIRNFSFEINDKDKISIMGDSGSGKSTLLNIILGIIRPNKGKVFYKGEEVNRFNVENLRNNIAWLPQNVNIAFESVDDFIKQPFSYKRNKEITPKKDHVNFLIQRFLLDKNIVSRKMSDISVGEKQRLLIIRALLLNRPILLFDEPTASLDRKSKKEICNYLFDELDLTIISVSHDNYWIEKCNKAIDLNI